jgi:hypothetical protein
MINFFESFKVDILKKLSREELMEARNGYMAVPLTLIYIFSEFTDGYGISMTVIAEKEYTNTRQHAIFIPTGITFAHLALKRWASKNFLKDLIDRINNHSFEFRRKFREWYSNLARGLTRKER